MNIKLTEREIDVIYQYIETLQTITKNRIKLTFREAITQLLNEVKEKLDDINNNNKFIGWD